ncbi:UPF0182 family membrane protein [Haloactinospora alba]|nr:UPF0182 family protein [Haloactinospora alba]
MPRRSRLLAPVAAVVVVIIAGLLLAANYWTDYKWFSSIGYSTVFLTELRTRALLFFGAAALMMAAVGASMYIAFRTRPVSRPTSLEQQGLERYRMSIDPRRKLIFWLVAAGLGVLTGLSATGEWSTYLQYANGAEFGTEDPLFNIDISFFAFTYPFLRVILGYLFAAVVFSFLAALVVHYLYGGVRLQTQGQRATSAARVHLSVLLGVFVLLKAGAYWLDRYGLVFSDRGYIFGGAYTDVTAVLYAKIILAIIALVCALLFFANIYFKNIMVPIVSLGLLVLSAILVGGVYPAVVQQFTVSPNEQRLERPYIADNIEYTRQAYGIDDTEVESYDAETELSAQQLSEEAETIPSVRLVDPSVVSETFQQMQQVRGFYQFPDVLDVDRYENEEGEKVDTIVSARELEGPPEDQDNWLTRHMVYTHGFGVVAAAGNEVDSEGRPAFTEYNIPPTGELSDVAGEYEPRIYYGQEGAEYVIVDAEPEYDYPLGGQSEDVPTTDQEGNQEGDPTADEAQAPADGQDGGQDGQDGGQDGQGNDGGQDGGEDSQGGPGDQKTNNYDGDGGVELSSFFDRILYAMKYQEADILLNDAINEDSQILYDRDPAQRVEKTAPFLTVDSEPYPAVVDGDVKWIVDAYTTTNGYPYSTRTDLANATEDTFTQGTNRGNALPGNEANYIRNSVKATVDAYDGSVTLYNWDEQDPVLQTWSDAFPGIMTKKDEISDELKSHLRYPDDLVKVQREMLKEYHITDPDAFYGGQDFWEIPADPTNDGNDPEPPYRQTIRLPGEQEASFSMTSTFVPRDRKNLAAFMSVNSDPNSDDYGKLSILNLPQDSVTLGPGQVQDQFDADSEIRDVLLPLQQNEQSQMIKGNLLTLPFAGGLLYVEPLYVQAEGAESAYPLLQQVMVGFGEEVAIGGNLQEALNNLFAGDDGEGPLDEGQQDGGDADTGDGGGGSGSSDELSKALQDAADAYEKGQKALQDGDFSTYDEANQELKDALDRAEEARDENDEE